ncbi:MAG: Ig-like domain-containing protein [Verrucomicrobiia bacterium]
MQTTNRSPSHCSSLLADWFAIGIVLSLFPNTSGGAEVGPPPRIVATVPAVGATEVDPALGEIIVTFDQDMAGGFSWTGGGPDYPKLREDARPFWRDRRTCVLPISVEPARYYRVGINSKSHRNFRSAAGVSCRPSAIYFTTQGADAAVQAKIRKPVVVRFEPANGAKDVSPAITELRVMFSVPMGGGFSWCGGGADYPDIPEGQRPRWSEDRKTCILPARLKPNWNYRLSLNSLSAVNFQSENGVPLEPTPYSFATAAR